MLSPAAAARRAIPALDRLLKVPAIEDLVARYGRVSVTETARALLGEVRGELGRRGSPSPLSFDEQRFVQECGARLARDAQPSLKPLFNLTGTVLHTNLGRALMADVAIAAATDAMRNAVALEFDVASGR